MSINEIVKQLVEESYSIPNGWFEVYFVEGALKFSSPMTRGSRSMDLTNYVGVIDPVNPSWHSSNRSTTDKRGMCVVHDPASDLNCLFFHASHPYTDIHHGRSQNCVYDSFHHIRMPVTWNTQLIHLK